ncbi:MAG: dTDP-4-amino-4,6-dideoxygalactose transaminase [Cyclobacteriaceae bacterium]|jgi:dTDP-4-amino-4,6-dideoxygalactose transaminase
MSRVYLLAPYIHDNMNDHVLEAINSGWVTTRGPQLDQFEDLLKREFGFENVVLTNTGTAALHLALASINIGKGDKVIVSDVSFCAVANAVIYQGAEPILIDSETDAWGIDPDLLAQYLMKYYTEKIRAIVLVHLYGQPSKILKIKEICDQYNIVLIEDAAEALGSKVESDFCGAIGDIGIVSFNGNKILTTGGGGLVISKNQSIINRAKYLSNQAKTTTKNHYWHEEVGFNYGMSNVSASIGLSQIKIFDEILDRKKRIHEKYVEFCESIGILEMIPSPSGITSNHWLNTVVFNKKKAGLINWDDLLNFFDGHGIELRRFWTPLHLQPAYATYEYISNGTGTDLFSRGLCLPSGAGLTTKDQQQIIETFESYLLSRGFFKSRPLRV